MSPDGPALVAAALFLAAYWLAGGGMAL